MHQNYQLKWASMALVRVNIMHSIFDDISLIKYIQLIKTFAAL